MSPQPSQTSSAADDLVLAIAAFLFLDRLESASGGIEYRPAGFSPDAKLLAVVRDSVDEAER